MSVRVSTIVWSHSRASGSVFLLMLALADQANDEGFCWPKRRTLARRLRVKEERSITKLAHKAAELGELTIIPWFDGGRQTSNRYRINLAYLRSLPDLWGEGVQTDTPITVSSNHQLNRQLTKDRAEVILPDWLPDEAWGDFLAYRKGIKAPVTELSAKRLLATLDKLRSEGHDPVQVIDQTIATEKWTGLFPLKDSRPAAARRPQTVAEANQKFVADMDDMSAALRGVFDD